MGSNWVNRIWKPGVASGVATFCLLALPAARGQQNFVTTNVAATSGCLAAIEAKGNVQPGTACDHAAIEELARSGTCVRGESIGN